MPTASRLLKAAYVVMAASTTALSGDTSNAARTRARLVTKPLLMPTLTAAMLTDPRAGVSPLTRTAVIAQCGGWVGDVALMFPGTRPFLAGAGAFGVGHAAYASGFTRLGAPTPVRRSTSGRLAATAWAVGGPVLGVAAGRRSPVLGAAVAGYAGLLSYTLARAGNLDSAQPLSARRLILAGSIAFAASDSLLGARNFVITQERPALHQAVMASYTAAQWLLMQGALRTH